MNHFYVISQEAHEIVPCFIIRFQNLRRQLTRQPQEDDVKGTFLSALRERLRTTLAVFDFKERSLEQVIDKALLMDKMQTCNNMSMMSLQKSLPTTKELRFQQAIQCTTCLNPGHSTVECTLRTHCPICHSKAHTIDQCEYNLLNKATTSVRRIEPQDDTPDLYIFCVRC